MVPGHDRIWNAAIQERCRSLKTKFEIGRGLGSGDVLVVSQSPRTLEREERKKR